MCVLRLIVLALFVLGIGNFDRSKSRSRRLEIRAGPSPFVIFARIDRGRGSDRVEHTFDTTKKIISVLYQSDRLRCRLVSKLVVSSVFSGTLDSRRNHEQALSGPHVQSFFNLGKNTYDNTLLRFQTT